MISRYRCTIVCMNNAVPPQERSEPVLELRNVRFRWSESADDVIDIDSLDVARGECVFVTGPSGSGKSTLLSLLGGVVVAREGSLNVLGRNLAAMTGWQRDRFRADHIGFVFQMFNLISYLSMVDNVILPCRFSRRRRDNAIARSGSLQDEAKRLLQRLGLDSPQLLQRPVTDLSIGQQQRVAAARALIGTPELLIADEPTSSLDDDARENYLTLVFSEIRAAGTTVLFVSHDRRLRDRFDRHADLPDINKTGAASL